MKLSKVYFSYFSPIQATRKVVYNVAAMLSAGLPNEQFNLTSVSEREKEHHFAEDELLVVALPSYGGRIPQVTPSLLRNFHGNNTPAVAIVTYGNRGYDDVLRETQDILQEQGFITIAGAAFICVHAVAPKVAAGRPDVGDLALARNFGKQVREKIDALENYPENFSLPGENPYRPLMPAMGFSPVTNNKCVLCMQCYRWCPMNAITYNNPNQTDASKCILCQGCVIRCPVDAREIVNAGFLEKAAQLEANFANERLEPELFL